MLNAADLAALQSRSSSSGSAIPANLTSLLQPKNLYLRPEIALKTNNIDALAQSSSDYIVRTWLDKHSQLHGPAMFGYINSKNENQTPLQSPDSFLSAQTQAHFFEQVAGSITMDPVIKGSLPWLHKARLLLLANDPELNANKSRFKKETHNSSRLKSEDILYMANAERISKLTDKQLLNLVNSLKVTIAGTKQTKNAQKFDAAIALTKYLLATSLQETSISAEISEARNIALKWVEGQSLVPDIRDKMDLGGIRCLSFHEIQSLPLDLLYNALISDQGISVLHLEASQLIAFINAVHRVNQQQAQHWQQENELKVKTLCEFVKQTIAKGLPLSARDHFESLLQHGIQSESLKGFKSIREIMRAVRDIDPLASKAEHIHLLRPEEITLFGMNDLMHLKVNEIEKLDHNQAVALSLVMQEAWNTIKKLEQAPNLIAMMQRIMPALRDRVINTLSFVHQNGIASFITPAIGIIEQIDSERPMASQERIMQPLISPTFPNKVQIQPNDFIKVNFSLLTDKDIQELDLDAILSLSPEQQWQWFLSNDESAILRTTDPFKMRAWILAMKYLHHKSNAPMLHLAIEKQMTLLRHTWPRGESWLSRMKILLPSFYQVNREFENLLDSFHKVTFSRQQVGVNGLKSLLTTSLNDIQKMQAKELLTIDLHEFSMNPPIEKVRVFIETAWKELNKAENINQLSKTNSPAFALYNRLNLLYQDWVVSYYTEGKSPSQQEKQVIALLENRLASCAQLIGQPPFHLGLDSSLEPAAPIQHPSLLPQVSILSASSEVSSHTSILETPAASNFQLKYPSLPQDCSLNLEYRYDAVSMDDINLFESIEFEYLHLAFDERIQNEANYKKLNAIADKFEDYAAEHSAIINDHSSLPLAVAKAKLALEYLHATLSRFDYQLHHGNLVFENEEWKEVIKQKLCSITQRINSKLEPVSLTKEQLVAERVEDLSLKEMLTRNSALMRMGYLATDDEKNTLLLHLHHLFFLMKDAEQFDTAVSNMRSLSALTRIVYENYLLFGLHTHDTDFKNKLNQIINGLDLLIDKILVTAHFIDNGVNNVDEAKHLLSYLQSLAATWSNKKLPSELELDLTQFVSVLKTRFLYQNEAAEYFTEKQKEQMTFYLDLLCEKERPIVFANDVRLDGTEPPIKALQPSDNLQLNKLSVAASEYEKLLKKGIGFLRYEQLNSLSALIDEIKNLDLHAAGDKAAKQHKAKFWSLIKRLEKELSKKDSVTGVFLAAWQAEMSQRLDEIKTHLNTVPSWQESASNDFLSKLNCFKRQGSSERANKNPEHKKVKPVKEPQKDNKAKKSLSFFSSSTKKQ